MKKFSVNALIFASSIIIGAGMSVPSAWAHTYKDYDDCVSVTWDHVGCGLIILFGVADIENIKEDGISGKNKERIKVMSKKGYFEKLLKDGKPGDARRAESKKVVLKKVCKMDQVLDMVEKGTQLRRLREACYRPVK